MEHIRAFLNNTDQHTDKKVIQTMISYVRELAERRYVGSLQLEGSHYCSYCQNLFEVDRESLLLPCGHSVHTNCLFLLFKNENVVCDPTKYHIFQCRQTNECSLYEINDEWFRKYRFVKDFINKAREQADMRQCQDIRNEDRKLRATMVQNMTIICGICKLQKKVNEEILTLDCNHKFCKVCLEKQIRSLIDKKKYGNDHICFVCQTPLSHQDIINIIGKGASVMFFEKRIQEEGLFTKCKGILIKVGNNFYPAGKKDQKQKPENIQGEEIPCDYLMEIDMENGGRIIECPKCLTSFCKHGCASLHRKQTCEQFRQGVIPQQIEQI